MNAVNQPAPPTPLLRPDDLARLREALALSFTSAQVRAALGLDGESALARGDLAGVRRQLAGSGSTETLIRLYLLGDAVPTPDAARALADLDLGTARRAGLLDGAAEGVRAGLDLRPYSELDGPDWWVVSDRGADERSGSLAPDHVLGIGAAGVLLAQVTVREPVGRALDLGTGCGMQTLHLAQHCESVTGTDISARALRYAATTAALNGLTVDLRQGSLFEPVAGDRFDLVVCNPPFVVGPPTGAGGWTYRDSGWAGDALCGALVRGLGAVLTEGGTAQLLANWQISADESWQDRVTGWIPAGCDAWVWQREVATPGEYAALWLRDAGIRPDGPEWRRRYDRWLDWFAARGVLAVGMGVISVRRTGRADVTVICEDVPQPIEQPSGSSVHDWFRRADWLSARNAEDLLGAVLRAAPGLVLEDRAVIGDEGWRSAYRQVRQASGLRWEVEVDDSVAGLLAACRGSIPVGPLLSLLAEAVSAPAEAVNAALLPVLADLIRRGFLLPT